MPVKTDRLAIGEGAGEKWPEGESVGSKELLRISRIERPLLGGSLRESPRNELEREVRLRFPDLQQPVSAILQNISATGMFIRSRDAHPEGSSLSFELPLEDRERPIRGEGEVVWTRRFELGAGSPAGMGIRFLDLEQESDRILRSFIAELYGRSGPPLGAAGGGTADTAALTYANPLSGLTSSQLRRLHSYAGCATARSDRRMGRRIRGALTRLARALRLRR